MTAYNQLFAVLFTARNTEKALKWYQLAKGHLGVSGLKAHGLVKLLVQNGRYQVRRIS